MRNIGEVEGLLIECPQCGRYELVGPEAVFSSYAWSSALRSALSCATRQAYENKQRLRITGTEVAEELAQPHMSTRVVDNQERLLREIAKKAGRPSMPAKFSLSEDFTLIDCYTQQEFEWHIATLKNEHLVEVESSSFAELKLSPAGWKQVQPLPRVGGIPGRCFVAMWFSDETRAAYDNGIEPAISEAGFKPIRIDQKEYNNEIPDEIIAEIRNSEFMVADFTGQRAGVYYEAGFAMGLGRKVIWCCRKDQLDRLHFDTNHKNHIDWKTPEELHDRLYKRIRATVIEQG